MSPQRREQTATSWTARVGRIIRRCVVVAILLAAAGLVWLSIDVERLEGGDDRGRLALVDRVGHATFGEPVVGDLVAVKIRAMDKRANIEGALTARPETTKPPTQRIGRVLAVGGESLRWQGATLLTAGRLVELPWKTTVAPRPRQSGRGFTAVLDRFGVASAAQSQRRVVHRLPHLPAKVPRHHLLVAFHEDGRTVPKITPLGDLTGTVRLVVDPENLLAFRHDDLYDTR